MKRRRFTPEFKRSIAQLLSEAAGPAEICRRYNLSSGQLYTWKKQYAQGHFDPADIERIADHITRFSLRGLQKFSAG